MATMSTRLAGCLRVDLAEDALGGAAALRDVVVPARADELAGWREDADRLLEAGKVGGLDVENPMG